MVGTHKISYKQKSKGIPTNAYKNRVTKTYVNKSKLNKQINRDAKSISQIGLAQVILPSQLVKHEISDVDIKPKIDGFLTENKVSSLVKVEKYEYSADNLLSFEDWKTGREICRCCQVDSDVYCDLSAADDDISYADMLQDCFGIQMAWTNTETQDVYCDLSAADDDIISYAEMLQDCFGIQLCVESSHAICDACASRLRDACEFKRQVLACEARLNAAASPEPTKDEPLTPTEETVDDNKYDSETNGDKDPKTPKAPQLPKKCAQRKTYKDDFKKISATEYRCTLCDEAVSSLPAMKSHRRQYHRFACVHCEERFKSQQMLLRHKLEKHQQDDSYKCNACDKSFFNRNGFRVHLKRYHMLGEKISCDKCDYECYTGRRMRDHQLVHVPSRNFRCKFCKKTFMRPSNLRQHEMIHTGVKNKVCAQCGQAFVQKASLNYHMAKHHPNVKF